MKNVSNKIFGEANKFLRLEIHRLNIDQNIGEYFLFNKCTISASPLIGLYAFRKIAEVMDKTSRNTIRPLDSNSKLKY